MITNRTLLPPNTLIFNSGWSLLNQTSLETPANQYYPVNITSEEDKWHRISTKVTENGYEVFVNDTLIALIPLPPPGTSSFFATASRYVGTWAFGGCQEHITIYSNFTVTAKNGTQTYQNLITSDDTLSEYIVAPLAGSVCLDGAKRDRLVWIGDFYHTVRVVAYSTVRWDQILGSIKHIFGDQVDEGPYAGFVPISPSLSFRPGYKNADPNWTDLVDYQDSFLAGIGKYFHYTGDVNGLKPFWEHIKKQTCQQASSLQALGLLSHQANPSSSQVEESEITSQSKLEANFSLVGLGGLIEKN
ncbi:hypothetical protein EK21DRAFT_119468 [Setomelanomma holmii]|uniref:Uncharacterized protein n=1 Tax=Setomelanomma holmii TaxID=210430 RepID=A0A9P4GTL7_9PLEO|nr:hypothetical protein EK21DRAFT_119468 [Setomelanomma holmii]